jgi:hypothetical protein
LGSRVVALLEQPAEGQELTLAFVVDGAEDVIDCQEGEMVE